MKGGMFYPVESLRCLLGTRFRLHATSYRLNVKLQTLWWRIRGGLAMKCPRVAADRAHPNYVIKPLPRGEPFGAAPRAPELLRHFRMRARRGCAAHPRG